MTVDETVSPPQRKRTRRTRAELRDLMLRGGKEMLFEIDVTLGFEGLTYSAVFKHLEDQYDQRVTWGSVHERLWPNQRAFQLDVIADLLDEAPAAVVERVTESTKLHLAQAPLETPADRRDGLRYVIRSRSYYYWEGQVPPLVWLAHTVRMRLWSLGPDNPEASGFREAIADMRVASRDSWVEIIRLAMDATGVRVRHCAGDPDEALRTVAVVANAAAQGLMTEVLPEGSQPRMLPTGRDGTLEEWYPDAYAIWAMACAMFELDGDDLNDTDRRLD